MQEIILLDEIKNGMKNKHTIMSTGEKRYRQICMKDKTAYIRAEGLKKKALSIQTTVMRPRS